MPNSSDTQPEDRLQVRCATASPDAVRDDGDLAGYQMAFYELAKIMGIGARVAAPGHVWRTEMLPRLLAALATPPTAGKGEMTYDIRDTMIEALIPPISAMKIDPTSVYSGSIFEALDRSHLAYGGDTPTADDVIRRACELATDTALSVIANHLANEPRTKAETALIEFAEGKARAMRDNDLLRASDRAIPREILQAFAEELK